MWPYTNWFKNPEYALRALDASYGGKMTNTQEAYHNTAIHIDIKCPLATDPTWSKLPKEIVSYLDKQFIGYFDKLLNILEPGTGYHSGFYKSRPHRRQFQKRRWRSVFFEERHNN